MIATKERTMLGKIYCDSYSAQVGISRPDRKYLLQCMALLQVKQLHFIKVFASNQIVKWLSGFKLESKSKA